MIWSWQVTGFKGAVGVMTSLRRPKRLDVYTSDEGETSWLVKGGEDLRLDQRVELFYEHVNVLLNQDVQCRQQQLAIKTYTVVRRQPVVVAWSLTV